MQKWGASHHLKKVSEPQPLHSISAVIFHRKNCKLIITLFYMQLCFHMLVIDWEVTTDRSQLRNYIIEIIRLGLAQHGQDVRWPGWCCLQWVTQSMCPTKQTDWQAVGQTDGRTPVRCITLTARLGHGNNCRIRYDTISYFNLRSIADISQLYLPRGNKINK